MTLTCDWNPYISPRAGQSWPYIVDHLTLAGEEKESTTLIALILQNSDIQEKTARNYLTDLRLDQLAEQAHRRIATLAESSDVRSLSPARDAVSDAEAAQWAALADAATEGPWTVDPDGDIGAPLAGGLECGMDGHPVLDCPECGVMVARIQGFDGGLDAAFIAAARTAVPRLLAEREALRADLAEARATNANLNRRAQVAEAALHELTGTGNGKTPRVAREVWERCQESHGLACATTGRARDFAARVEAENARLREGIESMMRDVGKAQPAHVTPGIVAVRLKALLADTDSAKDEGGEG